MIGLNLLFAPEFRQTTGSAPETIQITSQPICPGRISPMQYGQFMEYLCDLFPSMWSEKLDDGGFEGLSPYEFEFIKQTDFKMHPWYPSGDVNKGIYELDSTDPVNGKTCQKVTAREGSKSSLGISQNGIHLDPSEPCKFSIWAKGNGLNGRVTVTLRDRHSLLGQFEIGVGTGWKRNSAKFTPSAKSSNATISIHFNGPGTLWLDAASLMPAKTMGGWRPDVVKAVKEVKPAIIRLGGSVLDDPGRGSFDWKGTLGDPDKRPPFRAWGGLQQTGPGMEEFVQFCRMVDAEPLICLRVKGRTPKDAADEVAYFNSPVTTEMGALRAKNGHPEPYGVKYWQVGNEQGGQEYESIVVGFCEAIKAVDPSIKILSSYPSKAVLDIAGKYLDYTCPHHYEVANLEGERNSLEAVKRLIAEHSPNHPIKIGVTEWNTTAGDEGVMRASLWDLENALYCARYQNLIHRYCDCVEIANRSNLTNSFCSGMVQTDKEGLYLTPTYYMTKLYSTLGGTRPLKIEPEAPIGPGLDVSATLSEDGSMLTVFAVNNSLQSVERALRLPDEEEWDSSVNGWVLEDTKHDLDPNVTNSFADPERVAIVKSQLTRRPSEVYTFAPLTVTVLRFTKK